MTDPKRARVFDPLWRYTRSEATDLDALFKRIRRQQKADAEAAKPAVNVKPIRTAKAAK